MFLTPSPSQATTTAVSPRRTAGPASLAAGHGREGSERATACSQDRARAGCLLRVEWGRGGRPHRRAGGAAPARDRQHRLGRRGRVARRRRDTSEGARIGHDAVLAAAALQSTRLIDHFAPLHTEVQHHHGGDVDDLRHALEQLCAA